MAVVAFFSRRGPPYREALHREMDAEGGPDRAPLPVARSPAYIATVLAVLAARKQVLTCLPEYMPSKAGPAADGPAGSLRAEGLGRAPSEAQEASWAEKAGVHCGSSSDRIWLDQLCVHLSPKPGERSRPSPASRAPARRAGGRSQGKAQGWPVTQLPALRGGTAGRQQRWLTDGGGAWPGKGQEKKHRT